MDEPTDDDVVETPAFNNRNTLDADRVDIHPFEGATAEFDRGVVESNTIAASSAVEHYEAPVDVDTRPPIGQRAPADAPSVPPAPDVRLTERRAGPPPPPRRSTSKGIGRPKGKWRARALVLVLISVGLIAGFVLPFPGDAIQPNANSREGQAPVRLEDPIRSTTTAERSSTTVDSSERDTDVVQRSQTAPTTTAAVASVSQPTPSSPPVTNSRDVSTTLVTTEPTQVVAEPVFRAAVNHQGVPVDGGPFSLSLTLTSLSDEPLAFSTTVAQIRTGPDVIAPNVDNAVQLAPGERISVDLEYDIPADAIELRLVVTIDGDEVVVII